MDKIKSMIAFQWVAELGSFSAAADHLDLSGAMVSKHVAHLEKQLDVTLFNRTTRKVSLTEIGQQYYTRCKQLLNDLSELEDMASQMGHFPKGLLRIIAPIDFGVMHMAPAIEAYQKEFPNVDIHLSLENKNVDLIDGNFDLAIRITDCPSDHLIAKIITSTELCTYGSPGYLEKFGEPKIIDELEFHRCLQFIGTPHGENWIFRNGAATRNFKPKWHFASNNGSVLCQMAELGMGLVQAPDVTVAPYLKKGTLRKILCEYRLPSLPIYAMYLSRKYIPINIKSFVEFLTQYFSHRD